MQHLAPNKAFFAHALHGGKRKAQQIINSVAKVIPDQEHRPTVQSSHRPIVQSCSRALVFSSHRPFVLSFPRSLVPSSPQTLKSCYFG